MRFACKSIVAASVPGGEKKGKRDHVSPLLMSELGDSFSGCTEYEVNFLSPIFFDTAPVHLSGLLMCIINQDNSAPASSDS